MILKIEGSYHGHHDAVMVSVYPDLEDLGDRDDPRSVPYGAGYPRALTELTRAVPFNDARRARERAPEARRPGRRADHGAGDDEHQHHSPGRGLSRAGARAHPAHGVKLIFDEVKTGATIAYGGATKRYGVQPDMITLAKAICGGYPGGAIGMTAEIADARGRRHRAPVRHLQRQPARDGGGRGGADRGAHGRRLREARGDQREAQGRLRRAHRALRPARLHRGHGREGLRRLLRRAAARVPRLPDEGGRRSSRPSPGSTT